MRWLLSKYFRCRRTTTKRSVIDGILGNIIRYYQILLYNTRIFVARIKTEHCKAVGKFHFNMWYFYSTTSKDISKALVILFHKRKSYPDQVNFYSFIAHTCCTYFYSFIVHIHPYILILLTWIRLLCAYKLCFGLSVVKRKTE